MALVSGALGSIPEQTIKNFERLKLTMINVKKSVILRAATILSR